ncbi:PREDICTED: protein CNGC15c-like [Nelumbo nucifera]|uniref:Protein CNGC15c-like n=2 Tax=Nelumbo nucifera TaxID=4432 RepID=A0A1U8A317_NELNU|nr:PREDICTED: protein CNGC15c-like [Nelumbo nucifera]DAD44037.1 TPA_asm: hypothetical protein HUJ06_002267 [Nelumbo nucifera]
MKKFFSKAYPWISVETSSATSAWTEGACLTREGNPMNEMLFIIRGSLESNTTNGGRTGFFNSCRIGPKDFCGEELLTWALDPRPSVILSSSTRSVKAISEVEAFALIADDLKFVALQFRMLHSKQLRQKFRFYSHQWRTWVACFIQAAWHRFKRRKDAAELKSLESPETASPAPAFERTVRVKRLPMDWTGDGVTVGSLPVGSGLVASDCRCKCCYKPAIVIAARNPTRRCKIADHRCKSIAEVFTTRQLDLLQNQCWPP